MCKLTSLSSPHNQFFCSMSPKLCKYTLRSICLMRRFMLIFNLSFLIVVNSFVLINLFHVSLVALTVSSFSQSSSGAPVSAIFFMYLLLMKKKTPTIYSSGSISLPNSANPSSHFRVFPTIEVACIRQ